MLILPILSLIGCGAGQQQAAFEQAVACEMATGIVGAFHPNMPRPQRAGLQRANAYYHGQTEVLGPPLGKSSRQVDEDRRAYLVDVHRRMSGPDRERVTQEFLQAARRCQQDVV
ncbi:MAG TPA: hypothetical protein VEW04_03085 [Allosphingosinicella sp.]|nr:hypothetical protein [Allosphingosinicella sp.]